MPTSPSTTPSDDPTAAVLAALTRPVPDGVNAVHWSRLCTADSLIAQNGTRRGTGDPGITINHTVRAAVNELVRAVCKNNNHRAEQVVHRALSSGEPIATTWLALNEEWTIWDKLLRVSVAAPNGDELILTEQLNGEFELLAAQHDGDHGVGVAQITLPADVMAEVVARYNAHRSPVTSPPPATQPNKEDT